MLRKIVKIDEDKCNGCGECIPDCPEGALQIIDGKARLISDLFCDGLGACIKACPFDAMSIEEREAEEYNEYKVMENIIKSGYNTIKAHLEHLKEHEEHLFLSQAIEFLKQNNIEIPTLEENKLHHNGCPGSMQKTILRENIENNNNSNISFTSELTNWPIQLKLMNINAPYLENADLLICADCVPFAYPNFHKRFLKDRVLMMLCPKLDSDIDSYIEKLSIIFKTKNINSINIVKMEVPCCNGVEMIVKEAMKLTNTNIFTKEYTISIDGNII